MRVKEEEQNLAKYSICCLLSHPPPPALKQVQTTRGIYVTLIRMIIYTAGQNGKSRLGPQQLFYFYCNCNFLKKSQPPYVRQGTAAMIS